MMKTSHEDNLIRNGLTDPNKRYKLYNGEILDAYMALNPPIRSKLCVTLLNILMSNKRHYNPKSSRYDEREARRIYNSQYFNLEGILDRVNAGKYRTEGKNISNDISNLMVRLKDLDKNNIFYFWSYGKPKSYMFVIERDFGVWKDFNPMANVPPKTIKKIMKVHSGMIDTRLALEKKCGRVASLKDVEKSFFGKFLPRMILKMDKKHQSELPIWDGKELLSDYLSNFLSILNKIDDYDLFNEDATFLDRLPSVLSSKIVEKRKTNEGTTKGGKNMNLEALEADLVPKNENIVIEKRKKSKRKKINHRESMKAKRTSFKGVDPFVSCNNFLRFYREYLRGHDASVKFYPVDNERNVATQVMDLLIKNGKNNDEDFLRSWINHFISTSLRGNNIRKKEKTSLLSFKKTFSSYSEKYFRG